LTLQRRPNPGNPPTTTLRPHPILIRLADRGLLETEWEKDPQAGRPARHLYRLTADLRFASELATEPSQAAPSLRPRIAGP